MTPETAARTYWDLVEAAASARPDRIVLVDDYGRSLTSAQLRDTATTTAAAFAARGVGEGTMVSWQLPTTIETMVVMVALARLGAVQNPILPIWRASEVGFVTRQLGTEVIVVPGVWHGFDHVALAQALARDRPMDIIVIDHDLPAAAVCACPAGTARRCPTRRHPPRRLDGSTTRRVPPRRRRESVTATDR